MLTIEESVEISRPPQTVYEFVADYRNAQRILAGFESFEALDTPTASLGARIRATARIFGVRLDTVFEVVELEPGRIIRTRSIEGPPGESTWRFEQSGAGSTVTLSMSVDTIGGLGGAIQQMVAGTIRDTIRKSLGRLSRELGPATVE